MAVHTKHDEVLLLPGYLVVVPESGTARHKLTALFGGL